MILKTKLTPLFCSLVLASALTAFAAPEKVSLWPEGKIPDFQEKQIAAPTDVAGKPDFKPEEWRMPYLEWSEPPAESNRNDCCLILISGGSYINWCDVGLVEGWRRRFTAEGFQCVKLVYRTPRPEGLEIYRTAWQDGQRAVRLVRLDAAKRGYDPKKIGTAIRSPPSPRERWTTSRHPLLRSPSPSNAPRRTALASLSSSTFRTRRANSPSPRFPTSRKPHPRRRFLHRIAPRMPQAVSERDRSHAGSAHPSDSVSKQGIETGTPSFS